MLSRAMQERTHANVGEREVEIPVVGERVDAEAGEGAEAAGHIVGVGREEPLEEGEQEGGTAPVAQRLHLHVTRAPCYACKPHCRY